MDDSSLPLALAKKKSASSMHLPTNRDAGRGLGQAVLTFVPGPPDSISDLISVSPAFAVEPSARPEGSRVKGQTEFAWRGWHRPRKRDTYIVCAVEERYYLDGSQSRTRTPYIQETH